MSIEEGGSGRNPVHWPAFAGVLSMFASIFLAISVYSLTMALSAKELALTARPDPFTGTMARDMKMELIARDDAILIAIRRECGLNIERIDKELGAIERRIMACESLSHPEQRAQENKRR